MKSRKKKRSPAPVILAVLLLLLGAGAGGFRAWQYWGPSTERMPQEELFGVSGSQAAVMYNYELQKAYGIFRNGEIYLPAEWVQTILNKRFYRDSDENLVVYALPEEVLKFGPQDKDRNGVPAFLTEEDKTWYSAGLVETFTDIRLERFTDGEIKRIFISDVPEKDTVSGARGKTVLRSRPSVKGSIVADVPEEESLRIIPDHANAATDTEKWQRVMTADGYTGYIRTSKMYASSAQTYTDSFRAPEYTSKSLGKTVLLGWQQITSAEGNGNLSKAVDGAEGLNVVSPTWFSLKGNDGSYESFADRSYVESAHAKGLQVWALIGNLDDSVTLGTALKKTSVREKIIAGLTADAEAFGFDGINVDFELLKKDAVRQYLEFIRELSAACRKKGLYLSVDVPNTASFNLHYDREELGIFCDYVINMGYDEHTSGDDPGSTASAGFFSAGLEGLLEEVPGEKAVAGVPFYTRLWKTTSGGKVTSEAMSMKSAREWADKNGMKLTWDEDAGQYTGSKKMDDGSTRQLWLEDAASMKRRAENVRDSGAAGIAGWRLGLETDDVWGIFKGL